MSAGKDFTLVYYYVPEDCDDLTMPNAFAIPKALDLITLADIEKEFPLASTSSSTEDEFHFRFKYKYNGASVWLDLANKQVKVPKVDGRIIMKVTRKQAKNRNYKSVTSIVETEEEDGVKKGR